MIRVDARELLAALTRLSKIAQEPDRHLVTLWAEGSRLHVLALASLERALVLGEKPGVFTKDVSTLGQYGRAELVELADARSLAQPSTTITTQNQHYAVDGTRRRYRLWRVEEVAQVMDFDADYFDGVARTNAIIMAGNAVPPGVAKGILEQVKATL